MRNEKWYKETFDQVHVPDKLLGKVMNMENQTKEKKGWRYAMGALGTAFALFAASNGICYAATGETWVSRMTLWINGEKVEKDVTWQENGDGTFLGTVEMDAEEEGDVFLATDVEDITFSFSPEINSGETDDSYSVDCVIDCGVEEDEDGTIWLRVREGGVCKAEADITADLMDGYAEGDIAGGDGITFHYQVTQTEAGDYELALSAQLAEE